MKGCQRDRLHRRRAAHAARRAGDRPRIVLDREHYPPVKRAHIVPRVYQSAFAIDGQVAVHVDGADRCVLVAITEAGTRSRYYRRVRPTGEAIDDIEASLAFVEDKVAAPLAQVIAASH